MKAGDEIKCPKCGKDAFLVKKNILDEWTKKGEALACSSCSAVICELRGDESAKIASDAKEKLMGFLGEKGASAPKIESSPEEKRFCRDCAHFLSHPFLSRCSLRSKNVEPMDDCPNFTAKKASR